ncbi:type IV pilus modification PilV family protein [Flexistipes sinusarabici]|uniref:type IV pilus modification PilV family protein n=1 Tax=Flexistipes sinusarabici TaxID=2352 RepID=UPI0023536F02|nr:prepilin-type N-terminal cleavage/methylation domain-containing protein [Flexistipes sinusarabici]
MLNKKLLKIFGRKNQNAFSLVEIMVALVIFAIAMLGIIPLLINYMRTNVMNEVRNNANYVLQEVMSDIKNSDFDNISAGSTTQNYNDIQYNVSWTVDEDNSSYSQIKRVSIILKWQKPYSKGEDNLTSEIFIRKE